jgi:hypothetical protein
MKFNDLVFAVVAVFILAYAGWVVGRGIGLVIYRVNHEIERVIP